MDKRKFSIEVTEILQRVIEIMAESSIDAISNVKEMYLNEEIVLSFDDYITTEFKEYNYE